MSVIYNVNLRDRQAFLNHLSLPATNPQNFLKYKSSSGESIFHILAQYDGLTESKSIIGAIDVPLKNIIEILLRASGNSLLQAVKSESTRAETNLGQTPLHYAYKTGNIEFVLSMFAIIKTNFADASEILNELLNFQDYDCMRPLDMLAFRLDDDHKNFIKEFHGDQKNFKIQKQYEVYSWGRSDNYNLGYPQLTDEKKRPTKIHFKCDDDWQEEDNHINDLESIRDIKASSSFNLALSEDGQLYSWGSGINGRLGHGNLKTQIRPKKIHFDFKDENKKINSQKNKHKSIEGVEDLLSFHKFTSKSKNSKQILSKKKQVESEILAHAFSMSAIDHSSFDPTDENSQNYNDFKSLDGKKVKKLLKQTMNAAGQIMVNGENDDQAHLIDIRLQLSILDRAAVMRIACSEKHAIALTNTGSAYTWGENDFTQLGYNTSKNGQCEMRPRRVEALSKTFLIDVACGDSHSIAINNERELYVWGSNKHSQLGFDREDHPMIQSPKKFLMQEYMNSANKESFLQIYAKANYSVVVASSKNVYVSDKSANQFLPLFGKTSGHYKKLEHKDQNHVFTAKDYILVMDNVKSIYRYEFVAKQVQQQKHTQDKRFATEIYSNSNFIELYPTDKNIWALNSMRQLYYCKNYKNYLSKNDELTFVPVNDVCNVMKASITDKHQVIIKIVKKLDYDLMVRIIPEDRFSETVSLTDICVQQLSKTITLDNCLELLEYADHHIIDELKINCLKFIMLNLVSFFSEGRIQGTSLSEKMLSLPIYLIRDIENFLKVKDIQKFLWLDMAYFEQVVDYSEFLRDPNDPKEEILTRDNCIKRYSEIVSLYQDYLDRRFVRERDEEELKEKIVIVSFRFRQALRKQNKKLQKFRKDSTNVVIEEDEEEDEVVSDREYENPDLYQSVDITTIKEYLEMINEFIKHSIPENWKKDDKQEEQNLDHIEEEKKEENEDQDDQFEQIDTSNRRRFSSRFSSEDITIEEAPAETNQKIVMKHVAKNRKKNRKMQAVQLKDLEMEQKQKEIKEKIIQQKTIKDQFNNFFLEKPDEKPKKNNFVDIESELQKKGDEFQVVKQKLRKQSEQTPPDGQTASPQLDTVTMGRSTYADSLGIGASTSSQSRKMKKDHQSTRKVSDVTEWEQHMSATSSAAKPDPRYSFEALLDEGSKKKQKFKAVNSEQRKTKDQRAPQNETWGLKMEDDDEIDFEEVLRQEQDKKRLQEKRDAEFAQKMLEEELQRQEDEMMAKAMKYSLIDEGIKQMRAHGHTMPQPVGYQPKVNKEDGDAKKQKRNRNKKKNNNNPQQNQEKKPVYQKKDQNNNDEKGDTKLKFTGQSWQPSNL